jgi:DtxR family Mn-dependent transcriptional regulator
VEIDFSWDEVHEIAEQLEHIKSEKLINNWLEGPEPQTQDPIPKDRF